MSTYVLVHGAWHDGPLMGPTADHLRALGHTVHTPTNVGNREGADRTGGLEPDVAGLVEFVEGLGERDVILVGHSYGGMLITAAADRLAEGVVARLVYWSAFVPRDGESLVDMIPPPVADLFHQLSGGSGPFELPYPVWRDGFMNDADDALARETFAKLVPQGYETFADKARLSRDPAEIPVPKSYLHCQEDMALPAAMPWFPRLADRLGQYRYVWMQGGHEVCFTDPEGLARAIEKAGRP